MPRGAFSCAKHVGGSQMLFEACLHGGTDAALHGERVDSCGSRLSVSNLFENVHTYVRCLVVCLSLGRIGRYDGGVGDYNEDRVCGTVTH